MKRFWLQFGAVKSLGGKILPANRRRLVEFGKFGFFCSLFTVPRVAIEPKGVIFNCSLFTVH